MEQNQFTFSVIILSWNSNQTLPACLEALNRQTCKDFEVLLVDNGSHEPLPADLLEKYPLLTLHVLTLEQNIGFAAGNNYAAERAQGSYLALLNADAFPSPDWLERIQEAACKYPRSFFTSKLLIANQPERMDGAGDVYHASGLAWRDAYNTRTPTQETDKEVFSACAAAAVYPLEAYRRAHGFDVDYFSYIEDVDLGFRLRLLGYSCIYLPEAVVSHVGSASTSRRSDLAVYYGQRNWVWTFFKDMPGIFVWLLFPLHLLANLLQVALGMSRGQGRITLRAKWDAIRELPAITGKRKQVQRTRTVPIIDILKVMDWNPISPLIKLIHR
ncbi:MAG: glycosyltransferase family 2 protein [Acidobacteriaceae bacterium]